MERPQALGTNQPRAAWGRGLIDTSLSPSNLFCLNSWAVLK